MDDHGENAVMIIPHDPESLSNSDFADSVPNYCR